MLESTVRRILNLDSKEEVPEFVLQFLQEQPDELDENELIELQQICVEVGIASA